MVDGGGDGKDRAGVVERQRMRQELFPAAHVGHDEHAADHYVEHAMLATTHEPSPGKSSMPPTKACDACVSSSKACHTCVSCPSEACLKVTILTMTIATSP